jgi:hypothetical protein
MFLGDTCYFNLPVIVPERAIIIFFSFLQRSNLQVHDSFEFGVVKEILASYKTIFVYIFPHVEHKHPGVVINREIISIGAELNVLASSPCVSLL